MADRRFIERTTNTGNLLADIFRVTDHSYHEDGSVTERVREVDLRRAWNIADGGKRRGLTPIIPNVGGDLFAYQAYLEARKKIWMNGGDVDSKERRSRDLEVEFLTYPLTS